MTQNSMERRTSGSKFWWTVVVNFLSLIKFSGKLSCPSENEKWVVFMQIAKQIKTKERNEASMFTSSVFHFPARRIIMNDKSVNALREISISLPDSWYLIAAIRTPKKLLSLATFSWDSLLRTCSAHFRRSKTP